MFWEILKASKGLPTTDLFAALWGKKIYDANEWQITTLTGTLPLSFLSKGEALTNYLLHGSSEGAGVETENLYPLSKKSFTVTRNNKTITITCDGTGAIYFSGEVSEISSLSQEWASNFSFTLQAGTYYTQNTPSQSAFNQLGRFIRKKSDSRVILQPGTNRFTLSETTEVYLAFYIYNGSGDVTWQACLTEGSTAPASYIPYGYQIPLTVTSGEQSTTTPLYIGSSKLGEEEYLDYEAGKIYKMVSGVLTPTDPPVSLPAILTYQGENTLSSTETLGEVTIKGRIKEVDN